MVKTFKERGYYFEGVDPTAPVVKASRTPAPAVTAKADNGATDRKAEVE